LETPSATLPILLSQGYFTLGSLQAFVGSTRSGISNLTLLAISLSSAENIGAAKFLDKMNLSRELIPAILELAPKNSGFVS